MFSQVWLKCLVGVLASNLTLKWDNTPADYGSLFDVSEVISVFNFAVGTLPLSVVVRHCTHILPLVIS
jgi:hypothetical protein